MVTSPFAIWVLLGLCTGYVPNDPELTESLCKATFYAKHRAITVERPMDEFDRVYWNYMIRRVL